MKNLLVPIDLTPASEAGLEAARRMAQAFGGSVRLLHVAAPDPAFADSKWWPKEVRDSMARELKTEHDQIREFASRLEKDGVETKAFVARGPIAETILHYAGEIEADLIIMAATRELKLSHILPGSVIKAVLRKSPCAVLVVPASDRQEAQQK